VPAAGPYAGSDGEVVVGVAAGVDVAGVEAVVVPVSFWADSVGAPRTSTDDRGAASVGWFRKRRS